MSKGLESFLSYLLNTIYDKVELAFRSTLALEPSQLHGWALQYELEFLYIVVYCAIIGKQDGCSISLQLLLKIIVLFPSILLQS